MALCPDDRQTSLAAEFPPTSQAEWRKLVEAALKGASFEKRLTSQTYDGLRIEPLYPRAAGASRWSAGAPGAAWTLMQRVDHPDPAAANAQALQDLENGATGLTLVFAGSLNANGYGLDASPETIARVLDGVELDAGITIDFNLSPATRTAVQHFAALVKSRKLAPERSICAPASIRSAGLPPPAQARDLGVSCQRCLRPTFSISPNRDFAGRSRWPTGASSTMPAARKRRNWPLPLPPRWTVCARLKRAACRSIPRAA